MQSFDALIAISPTIVWVVGNIFSKKAARDIGALKTAAIAMSAGVLPMLVFLAVSPFSTPLVPAILSAIAGVFTGLGFVLYFKSLETQQISNSTAMLLIQALLLSLFGIYGLGESVTAFQASMGVLIIFGILLVSITKDFKLNKYLIPSAVANVCWSIYWVLLGYSITLGTSSDTAVIISRVTGSVVIIAAYCIIKRRTRRNATKSKAKVGSLLAAISGAFNGVGTLMYSFLVNLDLFALGSIMQALNPALVSALAYFVYKERLTKLQLFGMLLATVATIALSVF